MKLAKPNLFPVALAQWLTGQDAAILQGSLLNRITNACAAANPPLPVTGITEAAVEALDNRYFALQEEGDTDGSFRAFRLARLAAAAVELGRNDLESALYEFFHSKESLDETAFIRELESARLPHRTD